MRKLICASILLAAPVAAAAHEFWLDVPRHRVAGPRASVDVRFLVGDKDEIEPWRLIWEKVVALRSHGPAGIADQQAGITLKSAAVAGGARVALSGEGTHVIAFESYHAENDLPALDFNAYLAEDGLTPAIEQRRRAGLSNARGREIYSRRAKALVQVGARPTANAIRPVGHSLEIVPERNPYVLTAGTPLSLRIHYHGRPLAGAKVLLGDLGKPNDPPLVRISDVGGRATFARPGAGRWRASVVWTRAIEGHPRADWETHFASLTFGD